MAFDKTGRVGLGDNAPDEPDDASPEGSLIEAPENEPVPSDGEDD